MRWTVHTFRLLALAILLFRMNGTCGQDADAGPAPVQEPDSLLRAIVSANADTLFNGSWMTEETGYRFRDSVRVDTVIIMHRDKVLRVVAGERLSWAPAREHVVDSLESGLLRGTPTGWAGYRVEVWSDGRNIRAFVPNHFRTGTQAPDRNRMLSRRRNRPEPLVRDLSRTYLEQALLYNTHIALWHSHGWYYEPSLHRWEWQRARLFQTVEDLFPMTFTLQFLVPMLENAGACVLMPRERDWQVNEVVVDNDGSHGNSLYISAFPEGSDSAGAGFAIGNPPYTDENPFRLGSHESMTSDRRAGGSMQWIPEIPEDGDYAVYVSYHASEDNVDDARYTVYHAGGTTSFSVNQQIGGGTWVYLGRFRFNRGLDPLSGRVILTNESRRRRRNVTGDAVRFGGGMGLIGRNGMTSLRPKYQEAARYYLQYAGFPDSVVWKLNTPEEDYKDDYQSRGEWVSYLMEPAPGSRKDPHSQGLGIPVDMALALHTDAGISHNDTVIGTLAIFSTDYRKGPYPTGLSRMASRDLADLVQTQVVEDLQTLYDPAWTRRALWDKPYSEAFRPNAPTMLLELFSHQNLLDMRFGHEPEFRFHVSRAIYKGILRYLGSLYGTEYVVQPLPVDHFRTEILGDTAIRLQWHPVADPLEPTAQPDKFRVYTRINDGGYDDGVEVEDTGYVLEEPHEDSIYSFRVTALNRGGEGFPSEELSACLRIGSAGTVLVVNAFDRTSGPAWFSDEAHSGFLPLVDEGVPWHVDLHTVGAQYEYRKSSPWLDDDSPGHGASFADQEGRLIPGNSFDFSYVHGASIASAGYSFASVSDESVTGDTLRLADYAVVDYLAGEERTWPMPRDTLSGRFRVFTGPMLDSLATYLDAGGRLLVTGAHIASDVHIHGQDSLAAAILGFTWRTSNASRKGQFYFTDPRFGTYGENLAFNTGRDPDIYRVEGADALEPAAGAMTLARYSENNMSAAVSFSRGDARVVSMGFPFETILGQEERNALMSKILEHLLQKEFHE